MWKKFISSKYNVPYWYNEGTKESVWLKPNGYLSNDEDINNNINKNKKRKLEEPQSSSTIETSTSRIHEDHPVLAVEREKLCNDCLEVLVKQNLMYGEMKGDSKTSIACQKHGMSVGLRGMFARILWHQLLSKAQMTGTDAGDEEEVDGIFPSFTVLDSAVLNELTQAGRTIQQANNILNIVFQSMIASYKSIMSLRKSLSSVQDQVTLTLGSEQSKVSTTSSSSKSKILMNTISFRDKSFTISSLHMEKLLKLYRLHTNHSNISLNDQLFLQRVFCVLSRYETLSGTSDGYQMAFPDIGFQWLRDQLGVRIECFASPLNCYNQRFFSVAKDTDYYFGSLGNFFLYHGDVSVGRVGTDEIGLECGGSFEANPPFVESVMNQMAQKIDDILTKYENSPYPFSFSVVVPAWVDSDGVILMTNSRFLRPRPTYVLRLLKKKHTYRPGMQHRTSHAEQPSNVDTLVFFLQNDSGAKTWPVSEEMGEDLKKTLENEIQIKN